MTPEEKLCSRTWRLRNSAGVLWSILSFGFLTGVGFLIRGVKAKNKLWIQMGVGFLVLGLGLLVATGFIDAGTKEAPVSSTANTIWGWIWFSTFVAGVVLSIIMNRKWLVWKAHSGDAKWYAQAGTSAPPVNAHTVPDPHAAAAAAFRSTVPSSPAPAAQPASPAHFSTPQSAPLATVDVNAASAQDLAALGIDYDTAGRIVEARTSRGQFTSFEQLMSQAQVQPHLLIPHRQKLAFGGGGVSAAEQAAPQPTRRNANQTARRLDL
ncbi:helix-hairpin-helix domain-containing protein [Pseudarthrobacter sp. H3Y2-7]|uniref:ComEA family DNA-binding protein n=1 Tax=Pseudarthrobacter naphthalenicus TaxID=3031328 RepID=UPI0023B1D169|nr:helix-hairpin-helix domain-containing protein [Pseudarthrobacter sp. H3Y2-7]MDE8669839.1 helix-hairpin-helix domain-containing protein [Pseudarthrobacter sp. H3Y2-7]